MAKKAFLIITVFLLFAFGIFYFEKIKNKISSKHVYVLFNLNNNNLRSIQWSQHEYLFSSDFEIKKTNNTIYNGKLDTSDKRKFDSIVNLHNRLPRKFIKRIENRNEFGIRVSDSQEFIFDWNKFKSIDFGKIQSLDTISTDSTARILLENPFNTEIQWCIIQIDNIKNTASIAKAEPVIIDY